MNSQKYYNKNANRNVRLLREGQHDERNAHNFIKAVLIESYTKSNSMYLDLGCGKGGDVSKLVNINLNHYVGIDNSVNSLDICKERISKTGIKYKIINDTLWSQEGFGDVCFDIVSCQFSLHYAFENEDNSQKSLQNISNCLKPGGYLLGTIPISETSYKKKEIRLPGYGDTLIEPTVSKKELVDICNSHQLVLKSWHSFQEYYDIISKTHKSLMMKMKANTHPPKPEYCVVIFQKSIP